MIETFDTHRQLLFGIAYRMLGGVAAAEDIVQETWLRWQQQDGAEIRSAKAWLVSATTRLCIDHLRSARHTREEYYGVWLPEPLVETTAASPAESAVLADSLTMAFMMMLETLSPVERAVFLLREVFDYDYADIADRSCAGRKRNCRRIRK
jgi:RNA polymerase sigma-70 factor (ECF subfamily)